MINDFYQKYLNSDEWCKKRMHIAKINNYICQGCGKKTFYMFHIHHLTYKHLGNEKDDELVFLCKECHEKTHNPNKHYKNKTKISKKNLEFKKCKKCNGELEIRIFANKSGRRQQGIYCLNCGKWHKFISNREVGNYYSNGYPLKNTYGDLNNTKLRKYMKKRDC